MKRGQLISPGSLHRMMQEASEAWTGGDYQKCFDLLERACRLDPANFHIQFNLGQRYGLRHRFADAERCFAKAVRMAPNRTEAQATAARLSAEFGQPRMAEQFYLQATQQKVVSSDTLAALAELYERLHRVDDASAMVDRALELDGNCPPARLTQARMHRQAGRLDEAELMLRPVLKAQARHLQIQGYYELGAIHDRQGRYDDAMAAFLEAKSRLLPDAPPLLAQLKLITPHLKQMQENLSLSDGMINRWMEAAPGLLSPARRIAFLGGHARSGTTLLEQVLDSHPDIVSAEETAIFHQDAFDRVRRTVPDETPMLAALDQAPSQLLRQGRECYFDSMTAKLGQPLDGRLLIDKNPSLQVFVGAFVRFFPEAKLLIALRDPRDVVLSCFMLPHVPPSIASVNYLNLADTVAAYNRTMGMWQTLKPLLKNPWLEVRYEDMVEDLEAVARKSLDFLGVSWDARVLGFDEHARNKLVRSPTYADVTQPIYKRARGRWRHYQKYLEPHLDKLEPMMKAFGYN